MARKLSIMDSGWLMMETRETPMHVGGLALFAIPEDAPSDYMESVYRFMVEVDGVCRPFSQKIQSRLPGRLGYRKQGQAAHMHGGFPGFHHQPAGIHNG